MLLITRIFPNDAEPTCKKVVPRLASGPLKPKGITTEDRNQHVSCAATALAAIFTWWPSRYSSNPLTANISKQLAADPLHWLAEMQGGLKKRNCKYMAKDWDKGQTAGPHHMMRDVMMRGHKLASTLLDFAAEPVRIRSQPKRGCQKLAEWDGFSHS